MRKRNKIALCVLVGTIAIIAAAALGLRPLGRYLLEMHGRAWDEGAAFGAPRVSKHSCEQEALARSDLCGRNPACTFRVGAFAEGYVRCPEGRSLMSRVPGE